MSAKGSRAAKVVGPSARIDAGCQGDLELAARHDVGVDAFAAGDLDDLPHGVVQCSLLRDRGIPPVAGDVLRAVSRNRVGQPATVTA